LQQVLNSYVCLTRRITENWYVAGIEEANAIKNTLDYKPLLVRLFATRPQCLGLPTQKRKERDTASRTKVFGRPCGDGSCVYLFGLLSRWS
jgi:hypothetical protein